MLRKKLFLSTFFALVIGLIGLQVDAQILGGDDDDQDRDRSAKVKGEVTDSDTEEGLSNVEITVDETGESATTDEDGNFEFEDLEPGSYTLNVTSDGYEEHSESIEVTEEAETDLQINLRPSDDMNGMQDPAAPPADDMQQDDPTDQPEEQPVPPADQPQDQPADETQPPVPPMK